MLPTRFFCNPKTAQIIKSIKNKNTSIVIGTWEKSDTRQVIPREEKAMLPYLCKWLGRSPCKGSVRAETRRNKRPSTVGVQTSDVVKQNRVGNNLEVVLGLVCLTKSKDVSP